WTSSNSSSPDRCLAPKVPGSVGRRLEPGTQLSDAAGKRDGASLAPGQPDVIRPSRRQISSKITAEPAKANQKGAVTPQSCAITPPTPAPIPSPPIRHIM